MRNGNRFTWLYPLAMMAALAFGLSVHTGLAVAFNSLSAPNINPSGGNFNTPPNVTISDAAVGDPIYYTTDSSDPETSGTRTLYAGAFTVSQSETVTAAVYDILFGWSGLASDAFDIYTSSLVPAPAISPDGGSFTSPQTVTITGIPSGDICYYTTDGRDPTWAGAVLYTGAITVSQSEKIEAVNYSPTDGYSGVTVTTFNIAGPSSVPAPTISPDGGSFATAQVVSIGNIDHSQYQCYYTTDGSDPRTSATATDSSTPFIMGSGTVKAANYSSNLGWWSDVTSATFDISVSPPPAPSISPNGGSFTSPQTVILTGIPNGDVCYYSINSAEGDPYIGPNGTYTGPFTVDQSETIEATNYSESGGWSTTTMANFVIASDLAISPAGGAFTSPQTVTITGIPKGDYCDYTTDGSDPSSFTAREYTGPFTVSQTETVKAFFEGLSNSSVVSATFVINGSQTVAITPGGGSFSTPQSVTITGVPSGDTCSYTTDGSNPTTSSTAVAYSGAFTVSQSETVQAAIHDPTSGWGSVTAATFTIGGTPSSQAPIITPGGGTFTSPQIVTVTGIPSEDTCYYATDASGLKDGGYPYTGPFTVSQSETLYVANQNQAGGWGSVASATFTINNQVTVPPAGTLTPGEITTVAGDGDVGYSGDNGPDTGAWLDDPNSVAVDASGNLYIADSSNNCIRKVSASGIITTVAGDGSAGYSGDNGLATSAELNRPYGVAVDASGNLYIADTYNQRIRKVSVSGIITTVAGNGYSDGSTLAINSGGYTGDGGPATSAELNAPLAVAVDQSGNLYIADTYNNRIRKVSSSGAITTVAGNGQGGLFGGNSGDSGPATSAELAQPTGVAVDASGNIYIISDQYNNCIRKVDTSGVITTVGYGGSIQGYTSPEVLSTNGAAVSLPAGVAVDASGNLYCSDGYDCVRRIDPATGASAIVAGKVGTTGYSGDGGPATAAELNCPDGVAVDSSGDIFIADSNNNRIREVKATGSAAPSTDEQGQIDFTVGQSSYAAGGQSFAMDAAPFISNGRFLAPVLYLADALNAQTSWDAATRTITVTKGGTTIELAVGSMSIATNGKTSQMDASPLIENGRTYLPARYVAEALGYKVSWEAEAQAITVSQP